jgi:hypothetical protein
MTVLAGCSMVAIAVFMPHASVGSRLVRLIGGGSAVVVALSFNRPSKRNLLGMLVLTWALVVAVIVMR